MAIKSTAKWTVIIVITLFLSILHIQGSTTTFESHLLHQQLFFIPIILTSFWFRLPAGMLISLVISVIFLTSMVQHTRWSSLEMSTYTQILLYFVVAALIGWLTERLERQQKQAIKDEKWRSVTQLASAVSFEIQEVVNSLETRYKDGGTVSAAEVKGEMDKLKRLTRAFEQFGPPEVPDRISQDINEIVRKAKKEFQPLAKDENIDIITELDEAGCPSMVVSDTITTLFGSLVKNAIEASPENSEIILRTTRTGTNCILEVIDSGSGVSEENIPHLFKPFFTTKPGGHGLTLAAGKKVMQDYQGDLLYEPGKDGGAIFKLVIPRENRGKNLDEHIADKMR